jgi:hypothetical protein
MRVRTISITNNRTADSECVVMLVTLPITQMLVSVCTAPRATHAHESGSSAGGSCTSCVLSAILCCVLGLGAGQKQTTFFFGIVTSIVRSAISRAEAEAGTYTSLFYVSRFDFF